MKYYAIKVNNVVLGAHTWNQACDLWQDMGENAGSTMHVSEENRADWEDLGGNNIQELLENALKAGFIDNFDIDEIGDEEDAEKKGYWISPHPHFESVYETLSEKEAEEKLTIDDWQLHIGIDEKNVYAELEDGHVFVKIGEYVYKNGLVSFTANRAHYWATETLSEKCDDERLLSDTIFYLINYCEQFDFDDYYVETEENDGTLDFYDENGRHFAIMGDIDDFANMHNKLLAGGDPVADGWEYVEDEEEEEKEDD